MDRTESKTDTPVARESSAAVLIKRNLAEQSKWLNDPDPRPWVVHETQTIQWHMGWQKKCLTKVA